MNKLLQLMLVGSLVIGLLVTACSSETCSQNGSNLGRITDYEIDYSQSLEGGKPAPNFQFKNPNREVLFFSDLQAKAVLLNFWQTRCPPCVHEMPYLQQVYEEWEDKGLAMLAINVGEIPSKAEEFLQSNDLSLPVVLDTNMSVARLYRVQAFPTSFLTGEDRLIEGYKLGAFQSAEQIESGIKQVLQ